MHGIRLRFAVGVRRGDVEPVHVLEMMRQLVDQDVLIGIGVLPCFVQHDGPGLAEVDAGAIVILAASLAV